MKKISALVLVFICVVCLLCGCTPVNYVGDYPDLHTVAVRSMLFCDSGWPQEVVLIETDGFERRMFAFRDHGWYEDRYHLAVLIAQPTQKEKAYFYDGRNMVYVTVPSETDVNRLSVEEILAYFSPEEIEQLKTANDWGKEVDYSQCFAAEIVLRNKNNFSDRTLRRVLQNFPEPIPYASNRMFCNLLAEDADGKSLYCVQTDYFVMGGTGYLMMLDKKGRLVSETSIEELSRDDWADYRQKLYDFKVENGWNFYIPIEEAMQLNGEAM